VIINGFPDAPLEPPAMTAEQERINSIIYEIEATEKAIGERTDVLSDIDSYFDVIEKSKYLKFDLRDELNRLRDKIIADYESEIGTGKENVQAMKNHLVNLGYQP